MGCIRSLHVVRFSLQAVTRETETLFVIKLF